jgi:hypothetical protein
MVVESVAWDIGAIIRVGHPDLVEQFGEVAVGRRAVRVT